MFTVRSQAKEARIRRALAERATVEPLASVERLISLRRPNEPTVLIVEPGGIPSFGDSSGAAHRRILYTCGLPIIVYVSAREIRSSLRFVQIATDLVVTDFDDNPEMLRSIVFRQSCSTGQLLLGMLFDRMARLPGPVRALVRIALVEGEYPHRVDDWAYASRRNRRTLYRCFAKAGLASPGHVIVAARVSAVCDQLWHAPTSLETLASRHGYGSRAAMSRELKSALGHTASQTRRVLSPEDAADRLARFLAEGRSVNQRSPSAVCGS